MEIMICPGCHRLVKVLQILYSPSKVSGRVSLQKCPACGYEWSTSTPGQPVGPREFDPLRLGEP
jgi:hypothetical protein